VHRASEWIAAGVSRSDLSRLVAVGDLVKIRRGVYASAAAASASPDEARAHALHVAGVIARIGGGVASHHSAAVLHGLSLLTKPPDGTVTITLPPAKRTGPYGRAGVIRHSAELPANQVTTLFGLPVTTAGRAVVDIADVTVHGGRRSRRFRHSSAAHI
jgi:predicted transcriptional regulator of viral defense system